MKQHIYGAGRCYLTSLTKKLFLNISEEANKNAEQAAIKNTK
jgi:hypothetical protein